MSYNSEGYLLHHCKQKTNLKKEKKKKKGADWDNHFESMPVFIDWIQGLVCYFADKIISIYDI